MFRSMDYVYEVYKERSFTAAAKKLYISQPALSAAIKKVETKIGTELFDRNTNPVTLTDVGLSYIDAVERMYSIQKDFIRELNDLTNSRIGKLTVSAGTLISSLILPRIIMYYSAQYPGIQVEMTEASSVELHEKLLNGEIELLLDYAFNEKDYTSVPLLTEHILLAVPTDHKINQTLREFCLTAEDICANRHLEKDCPAVNIGLFADEPFLRLKQGNDMFDRSSAIFAEAHIVPRQCYQLDQLMTGYHAVKAGMGITFVTDTLPKLNRDNAKISFYKIRSSHDTRTLQLAYKRGGYLSHSAEAFIRTAQNFCQEQLFSY